MEHLTLLVLLLALAAGLVTVTVAAQLVHSRRTAFFRAFLANILLFDVVLVLALVFWYARFHLDQVSGLVLLTVLVMMAIPKLGWAYAFVAMSRLLLGEKLTARFTSRFPAACGLLLLVFGVLVAAGVVSREPSLVQLANWVVEIPAVGVAIAAAVYLLIRARRLPAGPRRRSLAAFGALHLVLLAAAGGSVLLGRFHPLASGGIMILYNLLPLAWIYRYQPVGPAQLAAQLDRYGITAREREVIELIREGKTNQEIADRLFISLATVKDHNYNIFRKTGVRNRVELVNLFRDRE
jgi:DNA-binding CsgD family transcriptional regulator